MGIATAVWVTAFVGRMHEVNLSGPLLLALILTVMLVGAVRSGMTSGLKSAVGALLIAGGVNILLVGSIVSARALPETPAAAAAETSRVIVSALIWIPGSLLVSALIGLIGGGIGSFFHRPDEGTTPTDRTLVAHAALGRVTMATTFCLIAVGGIVTSTGAGLAVPDWPSSFGYNMFLYPYSRMVGGIYYEHAHRLIGTLVGLQTLVLCCVIWFSKRSGVGRALRLAGGACPECGYQLRRAGATECSECGIALNAQELAWLSRTAGGEASPLRRRLLRIRWVAVAALCLVILQGSFGGLRVVIVNEYGHTLALVFAVVHALTAQIFLAVMTVLTWMLFRAIARPRPEVGDFCRGLALALAISIFGQTLLGALTRHFHYGWSLLAHILFAIVVVALALAVGFWLLTLAERFAALRRRFMLPGTFLVAVVVIQAGLGGVVWWVTTRYDQVQQTTSPAIAAVTSAHVVFGAALVVLSVWALLEVGTPSRRSAAAASPRPAAP